MDMDFVLVADKKDSFDGKSMLFSFLEMLVIFHTAPIKAVDIIGFRH